MVGVVETAKLLRRELRREFSGTKFRVRIKRLSDDEAIDVYWFEGPVTGGVEAITRKYEDVKRDERTGEILSGGNRYVHCHRKSSPALYMGYG